MNTKNERFENSIGKKRRMKKSETSFYGSKIKKRKKNGQFQ